MVDGALLRSGRSEPRPTTGSISQFNHANFGDVRIWGMYTGLQEDMSLGLLGGFKLPTGDHTYDDFDRDTSIGTGSTDLLLGAYKIGTFPTRLGNMNLTFLERPFNYYAQAGFDYPFMTTGNYVPGKEFDSGVGAIYNFGVVGHLKELAPMLSLLTSVRAHDLGRGSRPSLPGADMSVCSSLREERSAFQSSDCTRTSSFQSFNIVNGNQLTAPFLDQNDYQLRFLRGRVGRAHSSALAFLPAILTLWSRSLRIRGRGRRAAGAGIGGPGVERSDLRPRRTARQGCCRQLLGHLVPSLPQGDAGSGRLLPEIPFARARDDWDERRPPARPQ